MLYCCIKVEKRKDNMRIPEGKVLGSARGVSVREAVQEAVNRRITGYLVVKGEGIIIVDEGKILYAVTPHNASGEEALRMLLPMTADVEAHALDDLEMVILVRMLGIENYPQLNHVLEQQQPLSEREVLLRKYGIREPSEKEVEYIIKRAMEE